MKHINKRQAENRLFILQANSFPHIKKENRQQITSYYDKIMTTSITPRGITEDKLDKAAFQKVKRLMERR